jgi:beta-phosphoglucomutase-like phosphatase (HAD superfamily)
MNIIKENKSYITLVDGSESFINKICDSNKNFIIVSNSPKEQIEFFLELFPVLKKSSKNYYKEILKNKKPNPECYQKVLIDFPNKRLVGFEDSITGIQSITQVPEICTYFINTYDYIHYDYILHNYNVIKINSYLDLA